MTHCSESSSMFLSTETAGVALSASDAKFEWTYEWDTTKERPSWMIPKELVSDYTIVEARAFVEGKPCRASFAISNMKVFSYSECGLKKTLIIKKAISKLVTNQGTIFELVTDSDQRANVLVDTWSCVEHMSVKLSNLEKVCADQLTIQIICLVPLEGKFRYNLFQEIAQPVAQLGFELHLNKTLTDCVVKSLHYQMKKKDDYLQHDFALESSTKAMPSSVAPQTSAFEPGNRNLDLVLNGKQWLKLFPTTILRAGHLLLHLTPVTSTKIYEFQVSRDLDLAGRNFYPRIQLILYDQDKNPLFSIPEEFEFVLTTQGVAIDRGTIENLPSEDKNRNTVLVRLKDSQSICWGKVTMKTVEHPERIEKLDLELTFELTYLSETASPCEFWVKFPHAVRFFGEDSEFVAEDYSGHLVLKKTSAQAKEPWPKVVYKLKPPK